MLVRAVTRACELAREHCRADTKRGRHPDDLADPVADGSGTTGSVHRHCVAIATPIREQADATRDSEGRRAVELFEE